MDSYLECAGSSTPCSLNLHFKFTNIPCLPRQSGDICREARASSNRIIFATLRRQDSILLL